MSELSPEEEAEISRLLADSAPPVSMPTDVSARLDDVLADLVAERAEAESAPVVAIRRRRWPQVLVAAAAVSLFGYLGANVMSQQAAEDADSGGTTAEVAGPQDGAESSDGVDAPSVPQAGPRDDGSRFYAAKEVLDMLSYNVANEALAGDLGAHLARDFAGTRPCVRPVLEAATRSYSLPLPGSREAVVVLQRLNKSAARAYLYPCAQTVVPVSTSLLLGLR